MKSSRTWWLVFGACAAAVVVVLVWITTVVVRLEQREQQAQANAEYQESLRLALWRMDSWLGPRLARETARPVSGYTPAALGAVRSDAVRLHFVVTAAGQVRAVQRPVDGPGFAAVDRIATSMDLGARVAAAEVEFAEILADRTRTVAEPSLETEPTQVALQQRSQQELTQRRQTYAANVYPVEMNNADAATPGPFVPLWGDASAAGADDREPELVFVRRVHADVVPPGDPVLQGFLCDWEYLRGVLLAEIRDLFPAAMLVPVRAASDSTEMLASIPAELVGTKPPPASVSLVTAATTTLAVMWLAVLTALVAVAITLRASIAFGEKRSRFASAVTHELRTPLTTFRMYSEMLAEGMVTSEEQRQSYLRTLKEEADRLGSLVENVLAYSRLERGAAEVRPRRIVLSALLDEIRATLERQAARGGMTLNLTAEDAAAVLVIDIDGVTQILGNLVENAVKYAADASRRSIDVAARMAGNRLAITVRDHGPGIEARHARIVFAPFERGAREPGDTTPGVGLGLALSRGLARRMGGDLRILSTEGDGACFELTLPARS